VKFTRQALRNASASQLVRGNATKQLASSKSGSDEYAAQAKEEQGPSQNSSSAPDPAPLYRTSWDFRATRRRIHSMLNNPAKSRSVSSSSSQTVAEAADVSSIEARVASQSVASTANVDVDFLSTSIAGIGKVVDIPSLAENMVVVQPTSLAVLEGHYLVIHYVYLYIYLFPTWINSQNWNLVSDESLLASAINIFYVFSSCFSVLFTDLSTASRVKNKSFDAHRESKSKRRKRDRSDFSALDLLSSAAFSLLRESAAALTSDPQLPPKPPLDTPLSEQVNTLSSSQSDQSAESPQPPSQLLQETFVTRGFDSLSALGYLFRSCNFNFRNIQL
jgi:hypothetical protein